MSQKSNNHSTRYYTLDSIVWSQLTLMCDVRCQFGIHPGLVRTDTRVARFMLRWDSRVHTFPPHGTITAEPRVTVCHSSWKHYWLCCTKVKPIQLHHPLVASCSSGHEPRALSVFRWNKKQNREEKDSSKNWFLSFKKVDLLMLPLFKGICFDIFQTQFTAWWFGFNFHLLKLLLC